MNVRNVGAERAERDRRFPNMLDIDDQFVEAAIKNDYEKMRNLLYAGANPRYDQNNFALWKASLGGQIDLVHALLARGANPNSNGKRSIWAAIEMGHIEVVKLLLDRGGIVNVYGCYVIYVAARIGDIDMIDLLAERGADIGRALSNASQHGQMRMVRHLIAKGAEVRDTDALYHAAAWGHVEIVELLLREGANVEYDDYLALKGAASGGHIEIVRILLATGVPREAKEKAIEWAQKNHHMDIVRLLID